MKTSILTILLCTMLSLGYAQTAPKKEPPKKKKEETTYIIEGNQKAFMEISNKENPPHPPISAQHPKPTPTDTTHPHK